MPAVCEALVVRCALRAYLGTGGISLDGRAHLRITPWPAAGLPLRDRHRVHRAEVRDVVVRRPVRTAVNPHDPSMKVEVRPVDERISVIDARAPDGARQTRWRRQFMSVQVPLGETYLKLAAVDLESRSAIDRFVFDHGDLGLRFFRTDDPGRSVAGAFLDIEEDVGLVGPAFDVPLMSDDLPHESWWDALFAALSGAFDGLDVGESPAEMARAAEEATGNPNAIPFDEYAYGLETLAEFRAAAGLLQDAVALWRIAQGQLQPDDWCGQMIPAFDLEAISSASHAHATSDITDADHRIIGVKMAAMRLVASILAPGLAVFRPSLHVADPHHPQAVGDDYWTAGFPLYSICCAELFNHICETAEYRRCANERCERLFVRQEGRALKGTRRTRGVLYCSAACARAQAQREYRRRRHDAG